MPTIYIDNEPYKITQEGQNLLKVCLSLGFNIPYFCWHPAFHSVGACRQCAIKVFKDENDTAGKIVMSCMTPAMDGTRLSIDDPEALEFRRRVIEWLMVNHPHDCPVCDEGGECHLQDMTVMTGHTYRECRFPKRTFTNQYLGPFLNHEMNRCIHCYRCVRFYRHTAGGHDLATMGWHDRTYFGRHTDGVLENEFAGNLVEVCPTGVFTDKTLGKHYTRKWDMQTASSVCVHCGLGCNTIPAERYGTLRRVHARFNSQVNGYFLCDRGRFGYEFVNSPQRLRAPLRGGKDRPQEVISHEQAVKGVAELFGRGRVIGIGSVRASLESNYALWKLVGKDNFYHSASSRTLQLLAAMRDIMRDGPTPTAAMQEVAHCDAVFILGEDITNMAPMLVLPLREAVLQRPKEVATRLHIFEWEDAIVREAIQSQTGPLFIAAQQATKLDERATAAFQAAPEDIARLGYAVANLIDPSAPAPAGLSEEMRNLAHTIAEALRESRRPLIVSGYSTGSEEVLKAAANVAWALQKAALAPRIVFTVPHCNSMGTAFIDAPGVDEAAGAIANERADTVIVLETDLYRSLYAPAAYALLEQAGHVVVLDHLATRTGKRAEWVLPVTTFAESAGTLVNNETRAQRFYQVMAPSEGIHDSWRWLGEVMVSLGRAPRPPWANLDAIVADMARDWPAFRNVNNLAPPAGFRMIGQKIPRQPHRYSGRTAMHADVDIHDVPPPADDDSPLAYSMEGYEGQPPGPLVGRYWSPGWNSVAAINKFQIEIGGPLHGGDGGRRLIAPSAQAPARYFDDIPAPFQRREGWWLIVRAFHIFGSEELSGYGPSIGQLVPAPYLGIGQADMEQLHLAEGQVVSLEIEQGFHHFPLKLRPGLPPGLLCLPTNLPTLSGIILPSWGRIHVGAAEGGSP